MADITNIIYHSLNHWGKTEYAIINLYFTMPFCMLPCFALKVDRKKRVNIVCTSAIYLIAYVVDSHLFELM